MPGADVFGGIRVVELAQWLFVPTAAALLADWGADVVKIEHPEGGDGYRGLITPGGDGTVNLSMQAANHNKRSVALDLKTPEGRDVLLRLIEESDVFVTNYLPSVLDRLGLGVSDLQSLKPSLIYARGHGYGARGDRADTPAYDSTAFWARGGVASTIAPEGLPEPLPQRGGLGDRYAATHLAFGIAGALFRRQRTGEGSVVDVSLLGTAMWMINSDVLAELQGGFMPSAALGGPRTTLPNPLAANYRCADGRWLMICCLQPDKYWTDLCTLLGRPDLLDDERFADLRARAAHSGELVAELEAAFAARPLEEWRAPLDEARIPWGPYQTVQELLEDPQVAANGHLGSVDIPGVGDVCLPTGPVQFDEQPAALHPAPELGEHTDEVLADLGYSWDEIIALKVAGAAM